LALIERDDFRVWLTQEMNLNPPDAGALVPGRCEACGDDARSLFEEQCLVCWAEDFGRSSALLSGVTTLRDAIVLLLDDSSDAPHRFARFLSDASYEFKHLIEDGSNTTSPQ
jgi:hypothetical protein